ncbi:MAG: hypothetical protein OEY58_19575, partial [Gammaproteobacteria bacterium]|nr:hypothetical protein [Gammaproteobacteria bacterium]
PDYVDLYSTYDNHTFSTEDSRLISVLRINGQKRLLTMHDFDHIIDDLEYALGSYFEDCCHQIQVVFERDFERSGHVVEHALSPAFYACQRIHLHWQELLKQRVRYLQSHCVNENVYLALVTTPAALGDLELASARKLVRRRTSSRPPAMSSQQPDRVYPELGEIHSSFVKSVHNDFRLQGFDVQAMDVRTVLQELRSKTAPEFTDAASHARLPGDPLALCLPKTPTDDVSSLYWPPIANQLFYQDGHYPDHCTLQIGGLSYTSVLVELPPEVASAFPKLIKRIHDISTPFRIAFLLSGGGLAKLSLKKLSASITAFASSNNREIVNAIEGMEASIRSGIKGVQLQIALTTWSDASKPDLLKRRVANLVKAVQGWGSCSVRIEQGDPARGFVSTLPGASLASIGEVSLAPLRDALRMLPITGQSSPWTTGTIMFRTLDNRLWPYQPASAQQEVCIELYIAVTRSGKSLLANTMNMAYLTNGESSRLPYIAVMDNAPSSKGFIDLARDHLPKHLKHQVMYRRLRFSSADAINVFDTQLGCRFPLPLEKSFLINFVSLLATPLELTTAYPNTSELVKAAIEETYKLLSDDRDPKHYDVGVDSIVDAALASISYPVDIKTTWWEVTDALFNHGRVNDAWKAQRYAVPTIMDVISVVQNSASIKAQFGDVLISQDTQQSLIQAFVRALSLVPSTYPNLSKPTRLDLGDARVISLDLQEVAPKGGLEADRQTAVMYMAARHVLMNKFFLNTDQVSDMPEGYQAYHRPRIQEIMDSVKRVFIDEFHRTRNAPRVREQFDMDILEGGKAGIHIGIASQSIDHFTNEMINNAKNIFLLNLGEELPKVAKRLELSDAEVYALKTRVNGPTADGCPFVMRFYTRSGLHTQLLMLSSPPEELWALSTTRKDAALRRILTERLGSNKAREVLARHFPTGSAQDVFEQRMLRAQDSQSGAEDLDQHVVEQLAADILHKEGLRNEINALAL